MLWLSRLFILFLVAALLSILGFLRSAQFSTWAVATVEKELAKQGIYVSVKTLYFHPIKGLMASDLRLFEDEEKASLFTKVEEANLRLNYANGLKGKWELEGLVIKDAQIQLPTDPLNTENEFVEVAELSAEIGMHEDFIEVKELQGLVMGLKVNVEASLIKSVDTANKSQNKEKKEERRRQQWDALRVRRQMIVQIAKMLKSFDSPIAPQLDIRIEGDVSRPASLKFSAKLFAQSLKHALYDCELLEGVATFEDQVLDISRLYIRDKLGELKASALWRVGEPELKFQMESRADVMGFLGAVTQHSLFKEFVVYEPLELEAKGAILFPQKKVASKGVPVRAVGSFGFGKFLCRGEMFEQLSGKFSVGPEGIYVMGAKLKHSSGGIEGKFIWNQEHGMKYKALYTMDLRPFLPFITNRHAQQSIKFFEKHDNSYVHVELEGEAPDLNPKKLVTKGHAKLKNVTYRGVFVPEIEGDMEIHATHQIFSNLKVKGPDGTSGIAKAVRHDVKTKSATIVGAVADVNVAELVSCFAPPVARVIATYKFSKNPLAKADGVVSQNVGLNDLKVSFSSDGLAYYHLLGEKYDIHDPVGSLEFKGSNLHYSVQGRVFNQPMKCFGDVEVDRKKGTRYSADFQAGLFPYEVFGEELPFRKVKVKLDHLQGVTKFDGTADAFSGAVEMKGLLHDGKVGKPFTGEIEIQGIVYKEFAKVYSPGNDTEGDLTGHFKYSGNLGDWNSLKGSGAITLLNGNLYAVPILGPLTPLIGALLPKPIADYNVAKEADCTFTVSDGVVHTENIEAITGVIRLVAKGDVNFIHNQVKLEAQAKIRGLPGFVLTPISELFEYVGEGTISDPQWRPKYFSTGKARPKLEVSPAEPRKEAEKPSAEEVPEKTPSKPGSRRLWFFKKKE